MNESSTDPNNNVTRLFPRRNRFVSSHNGRKTTLEFDDVSLFIEWRQGGLSGASSIPLSRLSPRFMLDTTIDEDSINKTRNGLLLLVFSVVVYFSELNPVMPLLAPALALLGLLPLVANLRNLRPTTWSRIYDEYGNVEVSIPCQRQGDDNERLYFEQSLARAIERAREAEYGWW